MRIFIKYIILHYIILFFTFIRMTNYKLIALYFVKDGSNVNVLSNILKCNVTHISINAEFIYLCISWVFCYFY